MVMKYNSDQYETWMRLQNDLGILRLEILETTEKNSDFFPFVQILCDFLCSRRFPYFFKRGADSARGSSNMYGLLISTEKMR